MMDSRESFLDSYVDIAATGSFSEALRHFDQLAPIGDARGALDMVETIALAQRLVGDRWARGELSVAQEHVVTQINTRMLEVKVPFAAPTKGIVVAVVAEGEWHSLTCQLLAVGLGATGWDVVGSGPSMPARHLASLVDQLAPRAVVLSCSLAGNLPGAMRSIGAVRSLGVPVLAGGAAFGSDGRWAAAVGADLWAPTISAAAVALDAVSLKAGSNHAVHLSPDFTAFTGAMSRIGQAAGDEWAGADLSRHDQLSLLIRVVSAALLVDDRSVFDDHVEWMMNTVSLELGPSGVREALQVLRRHLQSGMERVCGWIDAALEATSEREMDRSRE